MLQIQFTDRDPISVTDSQFSIGSADRNDLIIEDDSVDPVHALLIPDNQQVLLRDNASRRGSYVNNIRVSEKSLKPGDAIRIGNMEARVLDTPETAKPKKQATTSKWQLQADSSWLEGQAFVLKPGKLTVGRGSQCDITIPGTHLSRQHAELIVHDNRVQVKDLASANGTFINDRPITEGVAKAGDQIRFDVYSFKLVGPNEDRNKTQVRAPIKMKRKSTEEIEKEKAAAAAKRWKTKPTSIGNRPEPPPRVQNTLPFKIVTVLLLGVVVAAASYVFLQ
ncbi:MAG: FHA domain-containing protein [Cellvibrionaceae bacterium]